MTKLLLGILLISVSYSVYPHARLRADGVTPPRNNNSGLKVGPCGGVPRTSNAVTLTAGEEITLTWEEVVQHPGHYEFSVAKANDENFVRLLVVMDEQDGTDDLPHQYSAKLKIPDITCDACTLQMIQVMTENPAQPRNYYSCADIKIVAGVKPPTQQMPEPVPAPVLPEPIPETMNGEEPVSNDPSSSVDPVQVEHSDCQAAAGN